MGAQVIGVSRDSMESHDRFIEKKSLSIPLISDESSELCDLFDESFLLIHQESFCEVV